MIRTLVFALLVLQSGHPARVAIVRPMNFVQEREYIRYMVQVDPQAENRLLVVAAVDGDVVRQSKEALDGESAPRTRWIEWKTGLPAGEYQVVAAVFDSTKEVGRASVPLTVIARF